MTIRTINTKWYIFNQNNSGGKYSKPGINVYIEALNAKHANERATEIDIYFNGDDCSCCGDRWDTAREDDSYRIQDDEPMFVKPGKYQQNRGVPCNVKYPLNAKSFVIVPAPDTDSEQ